MLKLNRLALGLALAWGMANGIAQTPGASNDGLAAKVAHELGRICFDQNDCIPPEARVLRLAEKGEVTEALLDLAYKYRDQPDRQLAHIRLMCLVVLGRWGELRALPLVVEAAKSSDGTLKVQAIKAIGGIDAQGNKALLLSLLQDQDFSIRSAAASALSGTDDPHVLEELDVQASREASRNASKELQAIADRLRSRISGRAH